MRGAKAIDLDVFRDLRHVAAVGRLMKDDIDVPERRGHRGTIAQIAFDELGVARDPGWFSSAVSLRLEIVEDAHRPTFAAQ